MNVLMSNVQSLEVWCGAAKPGNVLIKSNLNLFKDHSLIVRIRPKQRIKSKTQNECTRGTWHLIGFHQNYASSFLCSWKLWSRGGKIIFLIQGQMVCRYIWDLSQGIRASNESSWRFHILSNWDLLLVKKHLLALLHLRHYQDTLLNRR